MKILDMLSTEVGVLLLVSKVVEARDNINLNSSEREREHNDSDFCC